MQEHYEESPEEKKANIEEMQNALKSFDKVVDMLRYGRPSATKEQLIRKRALERRAKRKRGGHK